MTPLIYDLSLTTGGGQYNPPRSRIPSNNLEDGKEMGISDVAFHKKRGLEVEEMAKSQYVYKTLFRFRAGIEAGISWLKRCFAYPAANAKAPDGLTPTAGHRLSATTL